MPNAPMPQRLHQADPACSHLLLPASFALIQSFSCDVRNFASSGRAGSRKYEQSGSNLRGKEFISFFASFVNLVSKGEASMRRLCLLTASILLLSAWVVAQETSNPGSAESPQSSSNASQTTIEGCLSSSSGNYTLTDNSGKTYQLGGETSKLSSHVGHQVQIKGSEMGATASATTPSGATATANTSSSGSNPSSSSATQSGSSTSAQSGTASAAIQFKVDNIKHVSSTCTTPSTNK
jgi:hypothetical protein